MMERLSFGEMMPYDAVEASIHLNRYSMVKSICSGKTILDAACGEGYGSYLMRKWGGKEIWGLDIDEETVKKATRIFGSENVKFQCHTVEKLPFPDYYFDMIVSFETIEHLDEPESFLKEIQRVLKPGGMIILSCPNDPYYYKESDISNPFHKKTYTFFDFKEMVEQYLGSHVDYYLGFAVDGFLNMPISRSTEPSDAKTDTMLEMLNYIECSTLCVKQGRYLNHWNANYYVGIWGGNEIRKSINSVVYPRETFIKLEDKDIELIKEVQKWENNQEHMDVELKQKYDIEVLKNERLSMMLELLNKEIEAIRQNYNREVERLRQNDDRCRCELQNQQEALKENLRKKSEVDGELAGIKASKGWKVLTFLYKVEGIFRK